MRSSARNVVALAAVGLALAQTGCQSGAPGARFLSFFGLSQQPVVVALTPELGVLDPFTPHEPLRKALSAALHRPVQLRLCFPFQLDPGLNWGFYDFALVTPAAYAELNGRERFEILASSVDESGRAARPALLVVAADSPIQSVADLRGKSVAFGPLGDSRTHHAAVVLLQEHGLKKTDLSLSLLPLPGSLRHFPKMRDVALSVINGSSDAGFIDQAAFEELPETADVEDEPARSRLRVIAQTMALPDKIVVCSPKTDRSTVGAVADFLLSVAETQPEVLRPLLLSAYQKPAAELRAQCEQLTQSAPLAPPEQAAFLEP